MLYDFDQGGLWRTQTAKSEGCVRELPLRKFAGLLAFTTPAAANPSMKVPLFANVVQVALTWKNSAPRSVASRSALGVES